MSDDNRAYFRDEILVYIPLAAVAGLFVALRVFVKFKYVRNFGAEDFMCFFALVGL